MNRNIAIEFIEIHRVCNPGNTNTAYFVWHIRTSYYIIKKYFLFLWLNTHTLLDNSLTFLLKTHFIFYDMNMTSLIINIYNLYIIRAASYINRLKLSCLAFLRVRTSHFSSTVLVSCISLLLEVRVS